MINIVKDSSLERLSKETVKKLEYFIMVTWSLYRIRRLFLKRFF